MTLISEARTAMGVAPPRDPLSPEATPCAVSVPEGGPAAAESSCFTGGELHEPAKSLARTRRSLRALAKRRITDLHLEVCVGPWSLGWFGDADGRRLMRAPSRAPRSINKGQLACRTSEVRNR